MEIRYCLYLNRFIRLVLGWVFLFSMVSCNTESLNVKDFGKSSVDMVVELYITENQAILEALTEKLYKRNPDQLHKYPAETIKSRKRQLFSSTAPIHFASLHNARDIHAMNLAFDPNFTGDRVFALMAGLTDMLNASYNYHKELFLWNSLDENKLYRSARNIEILAWKLKAQKLPNGQAFLITDSTAGITDNTSFDRLYGKLIANQDMVARIMAGRSKRNISSAVQSATTFVFMPI